MFYCEHCGNGPECAVCGRGVPVSVTVVLLGNEYRKDQEIVLDLPDRSFMPHVESLTREFNQVEDRWRIKKGGE